MLDLIALSPAKEPHLRLFNWLADQPDNERPLEQSLLILCTPRCGSTFFSESLNSCGKLGFCDEWLNYDYFRAWMDVTGEKNFKLQRYLDWVSNKTLRNTGVWTLKLHIGQLLAMNQDFKMNIEAMVFDHIVYMDRMDKIAQAVSMTKAATMDQYRSTDKATGTCDITRQDIADALNNIVKFDMFAQKYLLKYIDAIYSYEDFCHDPAGYCNDVLYSLGKSTCKPNEFKVTKLKKQFDQRNADAIEDFLNYILGDTK